MNFPFPRIAALSLTVAATILTIPASKAALPVAHNADCDRWVDSVYNSLTPDQRLGQLFIPVVDPTDIAKAKTTLRRHFVDNAVGGILFSGGTARQYTQLTDYIQSIAKVPALITLDGEWGPAMRLKDVERFPYNMSLGAISDPALLYEYGKETARQCRLLGIQVDFAPVLDVNSNPDNPVIGYRSFGEDPGRVAALGVAYSKGMEDGGVMAVAKHFPGHGDTNVDSHKALPTVGHSRQTLNDVDLMPFARYIDEGLTGIMVGHLNVPALDPTGAPSSMSKAIVTGLLRDEMHFDGMTFTDALTMKGASLPGQNNSVRAFKAGADALLKPGDTEGAIAAMKAALKKGEITPQRLETAVRKMLAYKYRLGLTRRPAKVDRPDIVSLLNSAESEALRRRLVKAMITCVDNSAEILPVGRTDSMKIAVVNIGGGASNTFAKYCRKYADITVYSAKENVLSPSQLAAIGKSDLVIAAVYNDKAVSRQILHQLDGKTRNQVDVFFINPYKMGSLKPGRPGAIILVGEDGSLQQEYAAQAIFGGIAVGGRMPVNVEGVGRLGSGVDLPKTRLGYSTPEAEGMNRSVISEIDSLVAEGLKTGAFPGCQVIVGRKGHIVVDRVYGFTDAAHTRKVTDTTLYDLASVSKIAGTLPGIMLAYDRGLFEIDSPVCDYIPPFGLPDRDTVTVRQLLLHESGLPASINVYDAVVDASSYSGRLTSARRRGPYTIRLGRKTWGHSAARLRRDITSAKRTKAFPVQIAPDVFVGQTTTDTIMARIYAVPMRSRRGYCYSDLNFALLMDMEQRLTSIPHSKWVTDGIFAPIGAVHTMYRPLEKIPASQIAPTEHDKFMRRNIVQGYVHDELAAFSGGIQGNAGLFSTASDMAKLCQMWLNGGTYGGCRVLSDKTVEMFTTEKSSISRRGLGFDKPDTTNPDKSPTAEEADPSTYGHLGFTGTCLWIDPSREVFLVFLCNRIHPTRDNAAFSRLNIRPALMKAICSATR